MKKAVLLLVLSMLAYTVAANTDFPLPESLINDVGFWSKVYREWDSHQVVFYDDASKVVYDVIGLPRVENKISSQVYKKDVDKKFDQITKILAKIETKKRPLIKSTPYKKVFSIVKKSSLLATKNLSTRLRYQNGLRGRFEYGLIKSGRYAKDMIAILNSQGLPKELLAIVFVESLFYLSAESSAGASGPWGLVRETAKRLGIHINSFTDERLDPILSTFAATQFLTKAKSALLSWPLAITAYNYGFSGMMRAYKNFGSSDIEVILKNHESPLFGYASKNYYAEFLAALDTLENQEKYFPQIKKEKPWDYELVQVLRPVNVSDLLSYDVIEKEGFRKLNPAVSRLVVEGKEVIPPKYSFRLGRGSKNSFYKKLKKVPRNKRSAAAFTISARHRASGQESLFSIAKSHGISPDFLSKKMNKPLGYCPKGIVLIRSQAHLFSSLKDIGKALKKATTTIIKNAVN